jgi:tripartite-type tricarboxylate transporter receptor subunit TctC
MILVINRPGASTTLGTQQVARSAPDGHTLALVSVPHVANYTLLKEMPYAQSDFIPITPVTNTPNVLVVNPALPIKSVADLVAYIKARPGEVNYGTFGIGTSAHLAALLFESKIGAKIQPVHYRGGAPAAVGVMTGEVQMAFGTPLSVAGGVGGGKLRPIAVTSEKRINIYPDVATVREQGLDYVTGAWFGILAPAGTPDPIIRQLQGAITSTMADPAVRKTVVDSGTDVFVSSPEEFARFIGDQTKIWAGVLRGISASSSERRSNGFASRFSGSRISAASSGSSTAAAASSGRNHWVRRSLRSGHDLSCRSTSSAKTSTAQGTLGLSGIPLL